MSATEASYHEPSSSSASRFIINRDLSRDISIVEILVAAAETVGFGRCLVHNALAPYGLLFPETWRIGQNLLALIKVRVAVMYL